MASTLFAPRFTFLLITSSALVRVDLTGYKTLAIRQSWSRARFESSSLVTIVDSALKLGPRRTGTVWVMSSDFWTGAVSLPGDVSSGMSGELLSQAIALETESYSGISPFDADIGLRELESSTKGETRWWVTQIQKADLKSIEHAVQAFGASLGGAAHPALECLTEDSNLQPGDQSRERVAWVGDVHDTSQIAAWATAWGANLTSRPANGLGPDGEYAPRRTFVRPTGELSLTVAPPMLFAPQRPISKERQMAIAATLTLATLGACAGMHWFGQTRIMHVSGVIDSLEKQKQDVEDEVQSITAIEKRSSSLRDQIDQMNQQRRALERDLFVADRTHFQHRNRWIELIDALARSADADIWVQHLESNGGQAIVYGMAIDTDAATRLASRLELAVSNSGWRVQPPKTSLADNRLVEFRIALDTCLPSANASPEVASDVNLPISSLAGRKFTSSKPGVSK